MFLLYKGLIEVPIREEAGDPILYKCSLACRLAEAQIALGIINNKGINPL